MNALLFESARWRQPAGVSTESMLKNPTKPKSDSKADGIAPRAPRKNILPGLDEDVSNSLHDAASILSLISAGMKDPTARRALDLAETFVYLAGVVERGDDAKFMVDAAWRLMHNARTPNEIGASVVHEFRYAAKSNLPQKDAARDALTALHRMLPLPEWQERIGQEPTLSAATQVIRELRTGDTKALKMATDCLWKLLGLPKTWNAMRRELRRKRRT